MGIKYFLKAGNLKTAVAPFKKNIYGFKGTD